MDTSSTADPARGPGGPATLTRWQKFRLVVKVVELRMRFIAIMAATGFAFAYWDTIANHIDKWRRPPGTHVTAAPGIEFYCPMHPAVVAEQPGTCPICGMPLSKRAKGETPALPEGVAARVELAPWRVAQAGVRTVAVRYAPLAEQISTVGTVEVDERRFRRIASKIRGTARVEKLYVNFTGTTVQAGETLAEIYGAELYQAVQELLTAQRAAKQPPARPTTLAGSVLGDARELLRASVEKLKLWGLTQEQIDGILRDGKAVERVPILSPIAGVVLRKDVVEGRYVNEGDPLFEVADLSNVWVKAQIYEDQFGSVQVGQEVEATLAAFPGETFRGTVAFIDPVVNAATRTVAVRYDLPNPDGRLRPGMYATITLRTPVARTQAYLTHHPEAVREGEPARDLTPEEQRICLVTNAKLGSMGDPVPVMLQGHRVWICCEGCEAKLRDHASEYLERLSGPPRDEVLSVPESAVIDTGRRAFVYVEAEPGIYEAREVVLGPRSGDLFPVLDGLHPGERVAAAGAFLIDAENRLTTGSGVPYAEPAPKGHDHAPAREAKPTRSAARVGQTRPF
jgi:Cu(I)/Ag(I) efflux system membrane fusion protein